MLLLTYLHNNKTVRMQTEVTERYRSFLRCGSQLTELSLVCMAPTSPNLART